MCCSSTKTPIREATPEKIHYTFRNERLEQLSSDILDDYLKNLRAKPRPNTANNPYKKTALFGGSFRLKT